MDSMFILFYFSVFCVSFRRRIQVSLPRKMAWWESGAAGKEVMPWERLSE